MNREYYYFLNDEQQGPVSIDQLKSVGLRSDSLVWSEGYDEWTPANEVEELKIVFKKPPMPPPKPLMPPTNDIPISSSSNGSNLTNWLICGIIAAGFVVVGTILYVGNNSTKDSSGSSIFGNIFGKNYLSGVYEPVDDGSLMTKVEFFRNGTVTFTTDYIFEMTQAGTYTIEGSKVIAWEGGKGMPFFEIKDSNTLLALPIPMVFGGGEVWKKQ